MKTFARPALLALSMFAVATPGWSQSAEPAPVAAPRPALAPAPVAITALAANKKLKVRSPAFKDGAPIPLDNSAYGANKFPGLSWKGAPKATQTFAVIMQDSDPPRAELGSIVHWTMINIPASTKTLAPNLTTPPAGASNGPPRGNFYFGPRTPPGKPHHYRFQVFALDTALALPDGAKFADLLDAMKGHVLASGEVVGTYVGPEPAKAASN